MRDRLDRLSRLDLRRDAFVTAVTVVLAFAAFDDITTDSATSFVVEHVLLAGCAAWWAMLGWRLTRNGHGTMGAISLAIAALGVWSQQAIAHRPLAWEPYYAAGYAGILIDLMWFLCVSTVLARQALRSTSARAA